MELCPTCGNLLLLEKTHTVYQFFCESCPYILGISSTIQKRKELPKKEVDDVLGGEEAWKDVDKINAQCPKCGGEKAYYMQIQIRSADEPATIFYKCVQGTCSYQWRDG